MDTIIIALITLAGTIFSAYIAKNQFTQELDKKMAVMDSKMIDMGNDIREHNHYAKLFAETMPVVQEQVKQLDKRIERLEDERRDS